MNISDAARELLPCPFCGLPPMQNRVGDDDGGYYEVQCMKCNGRSSVGFCGVHADSPEEAVDIWNTRDNTATAALTLELETVKRENEKLLSRAGKLVAKALQLAQERDQLRQQLAEAREDSKRLDLLEEDWRWFMVKLMEPEWAGLDDLRQCIDRYAKEKPPQPAH